MTFEHIRPNSSSVFGAFDRKLRARDAAFFLGIARSTFFAWVKNGKIPKGIKLSNRCTVWEMSTLEDFVKMHKQ